MIEPLDPTRNCASESLGLKGWTVFPGAGSKEGWEEANTAVPKGFTEIPLGDLSTDQSSAPEGHLEVILYTYQIINEEGAPVSRVDFHMLGRESNNRFWRTKKDSRERYEKVLLPDLNLGQSYPKNFNHHMRMRKRAFIVDPKKVRRGRDGKTLK